MKGTTQQNVPSLRFPEFSGEWDKKKLGETVTNKCGKYNPINENSYTKCIELEHLTTETGTLLGYNDGSVLGSIKNKFNKGDVLFGKLRPYLKKYLLAPFDGVCSSEIWVLKVINISNSFLYTIIQTDSFIDLTNQSSGSKMPRADWNVVENGLFFFPSLPEQKKIAHFFTTIDDRLQILQKQKELLEQYKKGMMQRIFSQSLRFKDVDGNDYEEWQIKTLGEVAKFRRGSFPQPYGLPKWYDDENGMPFIQVYDVGDNMFLKSITKNKISEIGAEQSVFVKKGTLVITIQGSIGRIAKTQYDAYVDRTLLIFQSYNLPINVDYFKYVVFLLFEIEKTKAPGGTIKTITKEVLTDFEVAIPCLREQTKIANFLSEIDSKIANVQAQVVALQQWKKGLIQRMFV